MQDNNPSELKSDMLLMTDDQLYPFIVQHYVIRWNQMIENPEMYADICKEYAELSLELKPRLPFLTETQILLEESKLSLQLTDSYYPSLRYT